MREKKRRVLGNISDCKDMLPWDVTPFSPVQVYRRFRTRYFHHLPLWRNKHIPNVGRSVGLHGVTHRINSSPIISWCVYHFLSPSVLPPPKVQQPPVVQGLLTVEVADQHQDIRQSVGLLWTSEQPVAETSTWLTQHSQRTDIHDSGGIQTRNPGKRKAEDPRLGPRGQCNRPPSACIAHNNQVSLLLSHCAPSELVQYTSLLCPVA
jgi:hypothetical protein